MQNIFAYVTATVQDRVFFRGGERLLQASGRLPSFRGCFEQLFFYSFLFYYWTWVLAVRVGIFRVVLYHIGNIHTGRQEEYYSQCAD